GQAVSPRMRLAHELDILSLVENRTLRVHFSYNRLRYSQQDIEQLTECYRQSIGQLLDFCLARDGGELTPSDLTYQDLSIDELDLLFDE
ncbi:MAG: hypothetical protein PHH11_11300, partial [Methylomonas sp.]|nr:hypothetical protein [Methylomonas sp.]